MSKRDNTHAILEEALARIISGEPRRVPLSRKLSARSVEIEAGLSNGSAYYYPEFIEKISKLKQKYSTSLTTRSSKNVVDAWKEKAQQAERLKSKFREERDELKLLNARIAADQYLQMSALRDALHKISELEKTIENLNQELIETRRRNITQI